MKHFKQCLFLVLAVTLVAPTFAYSSSKKPNSDSDDVSPDKGDGCGLGWQVTKKRSFIATTTRNTTNSVVPPTFGMSSGTLDCEQHSFAKNEQPAVNFVADNQDSLFMDMAQGSGEHLAALSQAMGCSEQGKSGFQRAAHENLSNILKTKTSSEMYLEFRSMLKNNPELANTCTLNRV